MSHTARIALAGLVTLAAAACGPSASLRRSTPVANLQIFNTVLVRTAAGAEGQPYVGQLEAAAVQSLIQKCRFGGVYSALQYPNASTDLIVDLNIVRAYRGGSGFIKNPNLATMEVTMILSDGVEDELIGSADIQSQSSKVAVSGAVPEVEAAQAAAGKVADVLKTSGCDGPRMARPKPAPPPVETPPPDTGPDAEAIARAEAANNEGKEMFRAANVTGAKAKFEEATSLHPLPKYLFNLCLAHEQLKEFDAALGACQKVLDSQPDERLQQKATQRLDIIREKKAAGG